MKLGLVYDSETTSLPDWRAPSDAPHQPHLVQLAAQLIDLDTRAVVQGMDVIIKPEGWDIPQEVVDVHGITQEYASEVGIPEDLAVQMFISLWGGRPRIGHGEQFDARILRIALKRYPGIFDPDDWKAGSAECTARMSTPICAIPPTEKMKKARRFHFKTPNLQEAYRHFFGCEFEGAHTAIADVNACMAVYFAAKDHIQGQAA